MGGTQSKRNLVSGGGGHKKNHPDYNTEEENDSQVRNANETASNATQREKFVHELLQNQKKDIEIVKNKNGDYADCEDPFQNFRMVEDSGLMTVEEGIAVRMSDKMQRIFNLLDKEAEVDDETLEDTLSDLRNYANILQVYLNWEE